MTSLCPAKGGEGVYELFRALAEVCPHCSQTQGERGRGSADGPGRRRVAAGEALFSQGDAFQFLYTVRSGTFKSIASRADGREQICGVFGPTCDALDVISMSESLPADLELGELLYSPNIGAYSHASSTHFNGFPPARVVHVNR